MGKTVVLISSKGGCGKSTVAVGLATAFSSAGKSVLLIDADEGARCIDSLLTVDSETVFDLGDVVSGNTDIDGAILKSPVLHDVGIIPSTMTGAPVDFLKLTEILSDTADRFDYVIVDTKGQISAERLSELPNSACFIAVVTTDKIAVKNTGILCSALSEKGIPCRLIINRFNRFGKPVDIDEIINFCGATLIGIVPEDKHISNGIKGSVPFGNAAKAMHRIAARIAGQQIKLPKINKI